MLLVSGVVERLFSRVDTNNAGTPNTCKSHLRNMAWKDTMRKAVLRVFYYTVPGTWEHRNINSAHYMLFSSCSRRQRYQVIWWLVTILDDLLLVLYSSPY